MITIFYLLLLAAILGLLLHWIAKRYARKDNPLVDQIDQLLPQTQCGQCDYPGCRPYAKAIANGEADINRCPPGGQQTVIKLAELLGREAISLQEQESDKNQIAFIEEEKCIGCLLCIKACPVDAILGASKQMHTVITSECTGCELCVPVCPTNCIKMELKQRITPLYKQFSAYVQVD